MTTLRRIFITLVLGLCALVLIQTLGCSSLPYEDPDNVCLVHVASAHSLQSYQVRNCSKLVTISQEGIDNVQ